VPAIIIVIAVRLLGTQVAKRVVTAEGAQTAARLAVAGKLMMERLGNGDESDEDLAAALSAASGTLVSVATYSGDFEVRRLQVNWAVDSGDLAGEDVRVCTFHFLKLANNVPQGTWDAGDFEAVETAFDAFWATGISGYYRNSTKLAEYRWYREGPNLEPPLPPVRTVTKNVSGISSTNPQLPPQTALTVTERSGTHKNWGRFYLPAPSTLAMGNLGRPATSFLNDVASAADTLYEACRTANVPVVIYGRALPERPKKPSGMLPPRPARALTVDDLQVDDLWDVQRSRRYSRPLLRVQRQIG
jgi:hypothetical protein